MAPPLPNRHQLMSDVVEWVGKNWSLPRIAALPGMPSRATIGRWMAASPTFAQQLAEARMRARWETRQAWMAAAEAYNEATAQALLERVRCGDRLEDLTRRPEWPSRRRLGRWKAQRPDFAAALRVAVDYARRYRPRPYSEKAADALMARIVRGERLVEARAAQPDLPGPATTRRWLKADPDFAASYRAALKAGYRRRMSAARTKCTPKLIARVARRIELGDSLHSVAKRRGMPSHGTMYGWMKTRPAFAAAVRKACGEREWILREQALMRLDGVPEARIAEVMREVGGVRRRVSTMPRWPGGPQT